MIKPHISKKHLKAVRNPYLITASLVIVGYVAYAFIFTDIVVCRNCIVNDGAVKIHKSELDSATEANEKFYKFNGQPYDKDALRQETTKQLINQKLIDNYAQDKNITVSENEVDALYKDRITQSQSEEALLLIIRDMYGLNKSDYRNVLRQDILQEKVQASINMPLADWLNK